MCSTILQVLKVLLTAVASTKFRGMFSRDRNVCLLYFTFGCELSFLVFFLFMYVCMYVCSYML